MNYFSQKKQDQWVIEEIFPGRRDGFFLDLAATDGISLSNTYALETQLGWHGICIEPNPYYFSRLKNNRKSTCINACIDEVPGTVEFALFNELGGIIDRDTDNNPVIRGELIEDARSKGGVVQFETIPLADVLDASAAPTTIDYFSFDVEGSETRILRSFPFDKYKFLSLTIERPTVELNELLFSHGYVFIKNYQFDSFYVHESFDNIGSLDIQPFVQIPAKDW